MKTFDQLYHLQKKRVYNLALHYSLSEDDAADITQEVFIKVYEKLHLFKNESDTKTWVYRITVNTCIDFLRRKKRKNWLEWLYTKEKDYEEKLHPGISLENKELGIHLFKVIDSLPENQKNCFILYEIEQLKQQEIAAILKINLKAVESLLTRARKKLKEELISERSWKTGTK